MVRLTIVRASHGYSSYLGESPVHLAIHALPQPQSKVAQFDSDESTGTILLCSQSRSFSDTFCRLILVVSVCELFGSTQCALFTIVTRRKVVLLPQWVVQ